MNQFLLYVAIFSVKNVRLRILKGMEVVSNVEKQQTELLKMPVDS
jgi:hypothetical protein